MSWDTDIAGPVLDIAKYPSGPIRVLAGPGTGKSYALKRRVMRLLEEGIRPEQILAVTFTRVAAKDLLSDLTSLGVAGCEEVRSGTLHGLCFSILKDERVLELTGRTPRTMLKHEAKCLVRDLSSDRFGTIPQRERRLRSFEAAWARLQHEQPGWPLTDVDCQFQDDALAWLTFHRAMLVGEMVTESLKYLRDNPIAPERSMFGHVLVDEYQDLNRAEKVLIDYLASSATLMVIGDDDQSIYSFKYANPEGIIQFSTSHTGTHEIALEECRRCPTSVVRIANALIRRNTVRVAKDLTELASNGVGEVRVLQWLTLDEEAKGTAKIVAAKIQAGVVQPEEVLVLVPRKLIAYPIREALNEAGLVVQLGFEDETLDSVAAQERFSLLTLLADPDDRVALRVLMGYGSQDGRAGAWNRLRAHCETTGQSPWQALEALALGELKVPHMAKMISRFQDVQSQVKKLAGVALDKFIDAWIPELIPTVKDLRLLALEVLPTVSNVNELHRELRMRISQPEMPDATGKVRVMSLHKSKGLTAQMVVVVGCVEGLIPPRIEDGDPEGVRELEESRRLFYVALTRTRNILILSGARRFPHKSAQQMGATFSGRGQNVQTQASRFIDDLGAGAPTSIAGQSYLESL